jgi:4-hydroxy-2-oxoheptanedioate aldolase
MYLKDLRQRLRDRLQPPLVIVPVTLPEPAIVEIIGFAGAEAVLIDAEHGTIGPETMRSMLAHARSAGVAAVFRPRSFDAALCRQALDAGASGIHVSHVDTADEARAVVTACRYAPLGEREMSLGRAVDYNVSNISTYVTQANESELLVVMVESPRSLKNVQEIASVPGIDVLHVGTADLSHALGTPGRPAGGTAIREAVQHVISAADRHGVAVGVPTDAPEAVSFWAAQGVRYFEATAPDYLLREAYAARLEALRPLLDKHRG